MTTKDEDQMLKATFEHMRGASVMPSDALMDRIMLDADHVLAANTAPVQAARPKLSAVLLDIIGGWPSFGGLAAATLAGLWIGVSPPAALSEFSADYIGSTVEVPLFETTYFAGLDD